jgi:hypothetical protein
MELRLSSINAFGSCSCCMEGGKLYVGAVVYFNCSINKIHQYEIDLVGAIFKYCACAS